MEMEGWGGGDDGSRESVPDETPVRPAEAVIENSCQLRSNIDVMASPLEIEMLSSVYDETGDPSCKWAADIRDSKNSMSVAASAQPEKTNLMQGMEQNIWRPYYAYLNQQQKPMPLDTKGMMELSILATQVLRRGLGGKSGTDNKIPQKIAACLHMEFRRADEVYKGSATLAARKYDRDVIPVIFIDRPRLYAYLAQPEVKDPDSELYFLSQTINHIFNSHFVGYGDYKNNLYWDCHENRDFVVKLESWQASGLEEKRRYPIHIYGDRERAYPDSLNILTCMERWAEHRAPDSVIDFTPYRERLVADRQQFRHDQIKALAAGTVVSEPTLLDYMVSPCSLPHMRA